jgi:AsmA protein
MSKLLRILLTLIGALILLALVAIIGLVVFVNPNDLKPQIVQAVHKYTGRQLQLAGNIEWSIFPRFGLQLNDVKLSNAAGFGKESFAQIQKLNIQIRLLPLLHKQLEIDNLQMNGLTLYLARNAQGQVNWQGPAAKPSEATSTPVAAPSPITQSQPTISETAVPNTLKPLSFVVAGMTIQNGQIFFDDAQKKTHYEISQLQLKSSNLTVNKRSPFFAQFNLNSNTPKINSKIKLSTAITLSGDGKEITLNKLNFNAVLFDASYPKGELPIALHSNQLSYNLNTQSLVVDNFIAVINQNKFIGRVTGQNLATDPAFSGLISADQLKEKNLTIEKIQLPFQFKNHILSITPITGKFYQGSFQGDTRLDFSTKIPRITSHKQFNHVNIQALLHDLKSPSQIQLSGFANANCTFATQGNNQPDLIKNLQGQGQFTLDNGMIKGINLSYWVALGKALLQHRAIPSVNGPNITPFNQFMGSFTIHNGVLLNKDLTILSGRLRIDGKGTINLPQQLIDYELHAQPLLSNGNPDGMAIPLKVIGRFNAIRVVPLIEKLTIEHAKATIKNKLENQLKKFDLKKIFH